MSGTLQQATTDLETVSVTLQQTTTSVADLKSQLCGVNSSLRDIHSNLATNSAPFPPSTGLAIAGPTKNGLDSSANLQLGQSETPPLSINQMVAEIHRCLVLGESPTRAVNSSFQNAEGREKTRVVSLFGATAGRRQHLLSLPPHTAWHSRKPARTVPRGFEIFAPKLHPFVPLPQGRKSAQATPGESWAVPIRVFIKRATLVWLPVLSRSGPRENAFLCTSHPSVPRRNGGALLISLRPPTAHLVLDQVLSHHPPCQLSCLCHLSRRVW